MTIGIIYRDINTDVGDSFDVRQIVSHLAISNKVVVFCSRKNKHRLNLPNVVYVQSKSHFRLLFNVWSWSRKIDVYHLFCGFIYNLPFVSRLLEILNKPYLYSPFGQLMPEAMKKPFLKKSVFFRILLKRTLKRADSIQCNSVYEQNALMRLVDSDNYIVSSLAVEGYELEKIQPGDAPNLVSFIGRLDLWHKGLDILIEAVGLKRDLFEEKNIKIVLAGRGNDKECGLLNSMIEEASLSGIVHIEANISETQKRTILSNSLFFIHPSRVEGFARSMREAINLELPIITTFDSNVGDYINEFNAGRASAFDSNALAEAIDYCLKQKDPEFFKKGVVKLRRYLTWERLTSELENKYHYVLRE